MFVKGGYSIPALNKAQEREVILLYRNSDLTVTEIAKQFGICNATVSRIMKKNGIPLRGNRTIKWG